MINNIQNNLNDKNTAIAKTLLLIWQQIPDYEKMLENRAHTHALCSFSTPMFTKHIMEKIIDINVKRHTLRNLKNQIDKTINEIDLSIQKVIKHYYKQHGEQKTIKELAEEIQISERSFFRKLNQANDILSEKLTEMNINIFTWTDLLLNFKWIKNIFNQQFQPNHRRNPLR